MVKKLVSFLTFFLFPALCFAQDNEDQTPLQVSMFLNHGSWSSGDIDNSGSQSLVFGQLSYKKENWGLSTASTFTKTSYETVYNDSAFDITSLLDTSIAGYYRFEFDRIKVTAGLDAILPTGKPGFTDDEIQKVVSDGVSEDLMIINSYGSGLRVIPHVRAVLGFDNASIGIGARYEFTGEYDPTVDADNDNIDPGERLLVVLHGAMKLGISDYITGLLSYETSSQEKQQELGAFYRTGDTILGEFRYIRQWTDSFSSITGFLASAQGKNDYIGNAGTLISESKNSNNNSWELFINGVYRYTESIHLTGMVGYKQVFANDYDTQDAFYDAGRDKAYVSPGFQWFISKKAYLVAKVRYSLVNDYKDTFSDTDVTYQALNADAGIVYSF